MSSPEENPDEERRLTLIVVPHGDLETRSFIISYRKLKVLTAAALGLLLVLAVSLAFLFPIMAQAARVPQLERELQELEGQRALVLDLARSLEQVEAQYERVRQMLGADAMLDGDTVPLLPPLRPDTSGSPDSIALSQLTLRHLSLIDLWPLESAGYITRSVSTISEHTGVDIAVAQATVIRAAGAGIVRTAGQDDIYGHYVILDHGDGVESVYGHASRITVGVGDRVQRGDTIALSGSTGRSSAPHLHFEVRFNGRAVDPLTFVRQP